MLGRSAISAQGTNAMTVVLFDPEVFGVSSMCGTILPAGTATPQHAGHRRSGQRPTLTLLGRRYQ
eukprot:5724306-Pleurochrysis_carterae.AAC.1